MSNMHQCLRIPEIVYLIIQSLSYPPRIVIAYPTDMRTPDREDTKALLSFSLTSKSFLEPCLDALWSCMGSAKPLFNLVVPPDSRPSAEDARFPTRYSITNLIQIIDRTSWSRFHYYADRIKGLRAGFNEIDPLMGRALSTWSSAHSTPLLPNLLYLHWEDPVIGLYPCIQAFSGPSLTTLKLTVEPWLEECDGLIYPVFASLHAACPSLTALEIENDNDGVFDGSGRQLSVILAAFPLITRVGLWIEPSGDTLSSLATMPHLHTVINRMDTNGHLSAHEPALPSRVFPALRVLRWYAPTFEDATALLTELDHKPRDFQGLAIRCNESPCDADSINHLLSAIRTTCSPHTLSSLSLENVETPMPRMIASNVYPPPLRARNIAARLRAFGCMQECRLAALPITLDDDLLGVLSRAWPALRRLELFAEHPGTSQITLVGLHMLAARCPHLAHLEAEVGAWPGDNTSPLPNGGTGHSARCVVAYCADLEALDTACLPRRVAWVRGLFPHAQISLEDAHAPRWNGCNLSEDILADLV